MGSPKSEAPEAGLSSELAQAEATVLRETAPPPPPPPPAPPEAPDEELVALAEEKLEELAAKPSDIDRMVRNLSEEELAAVIELGFGLVADRRGPHWEISERRALRIAKWLKRTLDRYPAILSLLGDWLPGIVTALLLGFEVWVRIRRDRELELEKKRAPTPAPAPAEPQPEGLHAA